MASRKSQILRAPSKEVLSLPVSNSVRNADGIFINSRVFSEEGAHFMKYGYYCAELPGSVAFFEYWDEQIKRCQEGYTVGGVSITGHHYFYLNFSPIQRIKVGPNGELLADKVQGFPDFWDGDYNYYHVKNIARNGISQEALEGLGLSVKPLWLDGQHHMIVGKSRRKGYSYKNASICVNIYNTIPKSTCIIGAYDSKYLYPAGTMAMCSTYMSFLNEHTAWTKARDYSDTKEHKKASRVSYVDGVKVEAGYQSQIMAITFQNAPGAARGKDAVEVDLEEAGEFPNLKASFLQTAPGLTAGKFITGQITIFGTGGDMGSGTRDFADMYYNPEQFNLLPFENIWDPKVEGGKCGFFHPVNMNMEGFYDSNGNSDLLGAKEFEEATRKEILKNSSSAEAIQQRVQEWPLSPSEAFLTVSSNSFPVVELRRRRNKVLAEKLHLKLGQPVVLSRGENGTVECKPDLTGKLMPIWDYKVKTTDRKGAVVIYEYPISNPPKGLYKIGFDPYRQDDGPSLASITVYKGYYKGSYSRDWIVAQYVGRLDNADDVNRISELLAILYNTEVMHENEVTHVSAYYTRRKKLHLLAARPDAVIDAAINSSSKRRKYGMHMPDKIKDQGEKYIKTWLLTERETLEDGTVLLNLDTILDPALLEELILYNRKGNFDRVMSFMMVMFQLEEEELGKEYGDTVVDELLKEEFDDLIKTQFR